MMDSKDRSHLRDGILVMNKPQGMTSHDVVALARRRLGTKRIGHSGTLDPMARGVLVLLVEGATKSQQAFQACQKRYDAVIELGAQTDTADAWGTRIRTAPVPTLARGQVETVLASLAGRMTQRPPAFSAVKVQGRPLYWWARRGIPVEAPPRTVEITVLELVELSPARLRCWVECSSGTYIRSLAEVIADRLGTVGHVSELLRCAVGPWELAHAQEVRWLETAHVEEIRAMLQPVSMPRLTAACAVN
ncbi:MAG: tRNA pseudouridine(55) synthase TruB [Candidatus Omnitrophica bacterium]|nr:tRNA pseudouridine(55) synthase TruB [Candidatus Omnitrophota bacterium]